MSSSIFIESSKSPILPGTNSSIIDEIRSEHTTSSKEDAVTPLAHTPNSNMDQQDDIFNPQCTDSDEPISEAGGNGKTDEGVTTTENDCINMVSVSAEDNSQEVTERPHKKKTTFAEGEEARISQRDAWVGDLTEPASNGIVDTAKFQEAASTLPGVDSDHFKNKQGDDVDTSSVKMRFAPAVTVATTALRSKRQAQVKKSQSRILIGRSPIRHSDCIEHSVSLTAIKVMVSLLFFWFPLRVVLMRNLIMLIS